VTSGIHVGQEMCNVPAEIHLGPVAQYDNHRANFHGTSHFTLIQQLFVTNCYTEFHENPKDSSIVDIMLQTDGHTDAVST
jgi:hypothetical protein